MPLAGLILKGDHFKEEVKSGDFVTIVSLDPWELTHETIDSYPVTGLDEFLENLSGIVVRLNDDYFHIVHLDGSRRYAANIRWDQVVGARINTINLKDKRMIERLHTIFNNDGSKRIYELNDTVNVLLSNNTVVAGRIHDVTDKSIVIHSTEGGDRYTLIERDKIISVNPGPFLKKVSEVGNFWTFDEKNADCFLQRKVLVVEKKTGFALSAKLEITTGTLVGADDYFLYLVVTQTAQEIRIEKKFVEKIYRI